MSRKAWALSAGVALLLAGSVGCASKSNAAGGGSSSSSSASSSSSSSASSSSSEGSAPASSAGNKPLNIGFVVRQTNNPVFDAMAKGAQEAATQLGGTLTVVGPSDSNATGQIPYIQSLMVKKVDGFFITANDPSALDNSLIAARNQGITVVGMDSPPGVKARAAFVNDGTDQAIGIVSLKLMCEQLPNCTGKVAIISGSANSPNQNAWIAVMQDALKNDAKYKGINLVKVTYGDDNPQTATTKAQGLLQEFPDLAGFMLPSSVAMVSTAQVLEQTGKAGKVAMTGLALPSQMKGYVKDGTVKSFAIWNMADLGYLSYWVTNGIHNGTIKGVEGEKFTAGRLGSRTVGKDGEITVGDPAEINASNIDQFNF